MIPSKPLSIPDGIILKGEFCLFIYIFVLYFSQITLLLSD